MIQVLEVLDDLMIDTDTSKVEDLTSIADAVKELTVEDRPETDIEEPEQPLQIDSGYEEPSPEQLAYLDSVYEKARDFYARDVYDTKEKEEEYDHTLTEEKKNRFILNERLKSIGLHPDERFSYEEKEQWEAYRKSHEGFLANRIRWMLSMN